MEKDESLNKEYFNLLPDIDKIHYFFKICSQENNSLIIDELLKNSEKNSVFHLLVLVGIIGSIEKKQEKYIDIFINILETNKILYQNIYFYMLFNCALNNNNKKILTFLKNDGVNNFLNKNVPTLIKKDGEAMLLFINSKTPLFLMLKTNIKTDLLEHLKKYSNNPLLFCILEKKKNCLNFILENNNNQINNILLENIFIDRVSSNDLDSLKFILKNELLMNIIKYSNNITLFMNNEEQLYKYKKNVKALFLSEHLYNVLDKKNIDNNKIFKI